MIDTYMETNTRTELKYGENNHCNVNLIGFPCQIVKLISRTMLCRNPTLSSTNFLIRYGPSPLTVNGSLHAWTVIPRLANITAPTLVYNGEYDTSHDIAQVPFFEHIPHIGWITLPGGGRMCHLEGGGLRERILKIVGEFLTQEDTIDVH